MLHSDYDNLNERVLQSKAVLMLLIIDCFHTLYFQCNFLYFLNKTLKQKKHTGFN